MKNPLDSLGQKIRTADTITQTILFIVVLLGILFLGYFIAFMRADSVIEGNEARTTGFEVVEKEGAVTIQDSIYLTSITVLPKISNAPSFGRVVQQLGTIRMRYQENQGFFKLFSKIQYGVSMIQAISALLALVIGLIISKTGWANVKSLGLISFFVFTAFAAVLQLLPESLNIKENIDQNEAKFREYKVIEAEILSYVSTGLNSEGDTIPLPQFVIAMDKKIAKSHKVVGELENFPTDKVHDAASSIQNMPDDTNN